jgi:hypothetical protein
MRDCVFLVSDINMAAAFRGFLCRDRFHSSLGCGQFQFDPREDLLVDGAGNDSGVYTRAHELLRPYLQSHRHAVVGLDSEWAGSPGAERIITDISNKLLANGWNHHRFAVVVIEPELEAWIWQDSPHIASAFRYRSEQPLRHLLAGEGFWAATALKPERPKESMEFVLQRTRRPRSSAVYEEVTRRVSIKGCTDSAFQRLSANLRAWFPSESP